MNEIEYLFISFSVMSIFFTVNSVFLAFDYLVVDVFLIDF